MLGAEKNLWWRCMPAGVAFYFVPPALPTPALPRTVCPILPRSMVLEVLPSLMCIAAPALRPVSQHLYSPQEQETVR